MLAIRMQRRGRKGLAQFRLIVQDSRLSPKSEKVVAYVGSYDPHTKDAQLDKEKIEHYLSNGAQPSQRVIKLLQSEKISLPDWVTLDTSQEGKLKNPEKLRKNQPKEEAEPAQADKAEATESEERATSSDDDEKEADTKAQEDSSEEESSEDDDKPDEK